MISFVNPTPLRFLPECSRAVGCKVFGKLEIFNPTGSHKDRESEEIIRYAVRRNIRELAIASTGNAAISLAAYSYIHALKCRVYLPEGIASERLAQIEAFNPTITVTASYEEAISKCQDEADREARLNCNPGKRVQKIIGDSGIGEEISRYRWDSVAVPTNNGTLLAGVWRGMRKMKAKSRMVAAVAKKTRLAEGIAGFHRFEEPALSNALKESGETIVDVSDDDIRRAARLLASGGLIVEGAAAAGIAALKHLHLSRVSRVCCIITGTGLKFPSSVRELLKTNPMEKL